MSGRSRPHRAVLAALLLLAGATASVDAVAQPAQRCATCLREAGCDAQQDACVAECRARMFGIDPKRNSCLDGCRVAATRCSRDAEVGCRARGACS